MRVAITSVAAQRTFAAALFKPPITTTRARTRATTRVDASRWGSIRTPEGQVRLEVLTREEAAASVDGLAACEDDDSAWSAERLRRATSATRAEVVVVRAREDTTVIGYALCATDGAMVATIERVCVRWDRRRRGVGAGLLKALSRAFYAREIYDVGCAVPEELVDYFESQEYDEDEDGCVLMRFKGEVPKNAASDL